MSTLVLRAMIKMLFMRWMATSRSKKYGTYVVEAIVVCEHEQDGSWHGHGGGQSAQSPKTWEPRTTIIELTDCLLRKSFEHQKDQKKFLAGSPRSPAHQRIANRQLRGACSKELCVARGVFCSWGGCVHSEPPRLPAAERTSLSGLGSD
jgi:hypothetical protein